MALKFPATKDLLHYALVYGALLASWVPVMGYFNGQLAPTAIAVFAIFIVADKLAHKWILGEKF